MAKFIFSLVFVLLTTLQANAQLSAACSPCDDETAVIGARAEGEDDVENFAQSRVSLSYVGPQNPSSYACKNAVTVYSSDYKIKEAADACFDKSGLFSSYFANAYRDGTKEGGSTLASSTYGGVSSSVLTTGFFSTPPTVVQPANFTDCDLPDCAGEAYADGVSDRRAQITAKTGELLDDMSSAADSGFSPTGSTQSSAQAHCNSRLNQGDSPSSRSALASDLAQLIKTDGGEALCDKIADLRKNCWNENCAVLKSGFCSFSCRSSTGGGAGFGSGYGPPGAASQIDVALQAAFDLFFAN